MRAGRTTVTMVVCAVVLAGCATPRSLGADATEPTAPVLSTTHSALRLPPGLNAQATVQFDATPVAAGDTAVGMLFPTDADPGLNFVGVGSAHPRFQIHTNPSCVGIVVSMHDGIPIVVVLDSDAELRSGRLSATTVATAFSAVDGSELWGPVAVPGPVVAGSGLIFANTPKGIVSAATTDRVMLDGSDGSVVTLGPAGAESAIYEHHGIGILDDDDLRAVDTTTGDEVWTERELVRPDGILPDSTASHHPIRGDDTSPLIHLIWTDSSGAEAAASYTLATGDYLGSIDHAGEQTSMTAPTTGDTVITTVDAGRTRITAFSGTGIRWQSFIDGDARLGAATDDRIYLHVDGQGVELHWDDASEAARGDFPVPTLALADGSVLVPTGAPYEYALAR